MQGLSVSGVGRTGMITGKINSLGQETVAQAYEMHGSRNPESNTNPAQTQYP